MRFQKKEVLLFAGYLVLFLLGYYQTFSVGFLSDDFGLIYQFKTEGAEVFRHNFHDYFYLPLSHTIAYVQYLVFGTEPLGFRIVQYLVHLMNAWLLFLVVRRVIKGTDAADHAFTIAAFSGAVFLIHPYQTEGVVWLASRAYVLCTFFCLMAILFWMRYARDKKARQLVFALLWFTAALFTKEVALVLPVLIWGIEILRERRLFPFNWRILAWWLLPILIYFTARAYVLGDIIGGYGAGIHLVTDPTVWLTHAAGYFAKFFLTWRYAEAITGSELLLWLAGIKGVLIIGYLWFAKAKKWELPAFGRFGWRAFVIMCVMLLFALLPVLSLEMTSLGSIQSDRYGYFATLWFSMAAIWLCYLLFGKYQKYAAGIVVMIFLVLTWFTNEAWKTADQLTKRSIASINEQISPGTYKIALLTAPDTYRGAYMLRNDIGEACALASGGSKLYVELMLGVALTEKTEGSELRLGSYTSQLLPTGNATFLSIRPFEQPHVTYTSTAAVVGKMAIVREDAEVFYYDNGAFVKVNVVEENR